MPTSTEIANEFLKMEGALGRLTQMHLQKLVYIAHGWKLALAEEPLVSDRIEAWDYGPVFPDLYSHTKYNGKKPLTRLITPLDSSPVAFFDKKHTAKAYSAHLSETDQEILKRIWGKYGALSAFKLSDLTHKKGTPWYNAFYESGRGSKIEDPAIRDHYARLAQAA